MPKTVTEKIILYENHAEPVELLYYPTSHAYKINGEKKMGTSSVPDIIDKVGLRYYYMNEAINSLYRDLVPNNDSTFLQPTDEQWQEFVKKAKLAHTIRSTRGKDNGTRTHSWLEDFLTAKRDGSPTPELPKLEVVPKNEKGVSWAIVDEIEVKTELNNLIEALSQFVEWWDQHEIEVVAFERVIYSKQYDYAGRFDAILRIDGILYLVDFKTNNSTAEFPKGVFPDMFCQIGGYDVAYTEEMAPELHTKNQSLFDGHAVFNFSKKTGRFNKRFNDETQVKVARAWFVNTLGTKRGEQYFTRKMSMKYKENR